MDKLFAVNGSRAVLLYILADLICVGAGMGVPIFCILFGFPLGWYITRRVSLTAVDCREVYSKILELSVFAGIFTFLTMVVIWGRMLIMLFDPTTDFKNFGHPFILYDPKASFVGWSILMIFVSPFLQLVTTIFASFVTLMNNESYNRKSV